MANFKWILIVAAVLLINNILLLNFIGYFDAPDGLDEFKKPLDSQYAQVQSDSNSLSMNNNSSKVVVSKTSSNISNESLSESRSGRTEEMQHQVEAIVRDLIRSEEFGEVMMEQQLVSWKKARDKQSELKNFSGQQALEAYLNSESIMDRQTLLQTIVSEKLDELDAFELKSLFLDLDESNEDVGLWYRGKVATRLMEKEEAEGVELAKSLLQRMDQSKHLSHEFFEELYRMDPDYITRTINDSSLEYLMRTRLVSNLVHKDENLLKLFYERHLDELITSDNRKWIEMNRFGGQVELSSRQMSRIADMFSSEDKEWRLFAATLAGNLDDIDVLRSSYEVLNSRSERAAFLRSLLQYGSTDAHVALGEELSQTSDDPTIKNMASRRGGL